MWNGALSSFDGVQSELQTLALNVFQEQFHEYEGVASEFSSWKREVNELRESVRSIEEVYSRRQNNLKMNAVIYRGTLRQRRL